MKNELTAEEKKVLNADEAGTPEDGKQEAGKPEAAPSPKSGKKKLRLPFKFSRKKAVIAAVIILACIGLWMYLNSPMEVRMETMERGDYADTFTERGVIKSGTDLHYFSEIEARVLEVPVKKNDSVSKGDLLVRLDPTELEYQRSSHENALRQYRAEWEKNHYSAGMEVSPQAYLNIAKSEKEAAQKKLSYLENYTAGVRALYATGDESLQNLQQAEADLTAAKSEYETAQQKYQDAYSRFGESENNVNEEYYSADDQLYAAKVAEEESQIQMLEEKIERCSVRAERDGIVTELPAETISRVQPGDALVTIGGNSDRRLEARVLTNQEPYLHVGDPVTLTQRLKSEYITYEGVISEIDNYAQKGVSALGAEEYRVRVVVQVSSGEALKDGYELDALFTTYSSANSLSVPNSALFKADGQDCVFVVSGGKARLREVDISHRGVLRSEIASGLSEGEEIIIDANQKELMDGTPVTD